MPTKRQTSILGFDSGDRLLFGSGAASPGSLTFTSGDALVLTTDRTDLLIDFDKTAFGALRAAIDYSIDFGLEFNASLGDIPNFSTDMTSTVTAEYESLVFAADLPQVDGDLMQTFRFVDFEVLAANSSSAGLNTGGTFVDKFGNTQSTPLGLQLNLVAGFSASITDLYARAPLSSEGTDFPDITIVREENFRLPLFTLDAGNATVNKKLGDLFELNLRLPAGAKTEGSSFGSTIVGDKGFSGVRFIELVGDLDGMLLELIKVIPGFGSAAATFLGNTLFFDETYSIEDTIPFLDKDTFGFDVVAVDVDGRGGLKITEELVVDYGTDKLPEDDSVRLFSGSDFLREFQEAFGNTQLPDVIDPGLGETPNVTITLVSDNGTPNDLTDDRAGQGVLGEDIQVAAPSPGDGGPDVRTVTVDAFFDIGNVNVAHTVGIAGSFDIATTVLKGNTSGTLGGLLGISLGPLFEVTTPEDGFDFSLFDVFTNTFTISGGEFTLPDDGFVPEADPEAELVGGLEYTPGEFGNTPSTAQYEYTYARFKPPGFDANDENALETVERFNLSVGERIVAANDVVKTLLPGQDRNPVLLGDAGTENLIDFYESRNLADPLTNQYALWVAPNPGRSIVQLIAGDQSENRNLLMVAPTEFRAPGNEVTFANFGLSFDQRTFVQSPVLFGPDFQTSATNLSVTPFGELPSNASLGAYFDQNLAMRISASNFRATQTYQYRVDDTNNASDFRTIEVRDRSNFSGVLPTVFDFQALSANVLGTSENDVVVYTGSVSGTDPTRVEAPQYLDGGGAGQDNDVLIADFRNLAPDTRVAWDIRAQQLNEEGKDLTTLVDAFGEGQNAILGNFEGSVVQFLRQDGSLSHETVVRDIENYVIRFGDLDDVLRTGEAFNQYIEMGRGNDQLGITLDGTGNKDRYSLGDGDDTAVVFQSQPFPEGFDVVLPTQLSGGQGYDVVHFTIDETVVDAGLAVTQGAQWRFLSGGEADIFEKSSAAFKPFVGASDISVMSTEAIFSLADSVADVLGANDGSRLFRDAWSGVAQDTLEGFDRIEIIHSIGSFRSMQVASDFEELSYEGDDRLDDLVIYGGGDTYTGGDQTSSLLDQPTDIFVADFSLWEDAKALAFTEPDGALTTRPAGGVVMQADGLVTFADANIRGFEQFFIRGTSQADVFRSSVENSLFDGGAGNDQFRSDDGRDTLIGGEGSDLFSVVLPGDGVTGSVRIVGDGREGVDTFERVDRQDADFLILSAEGGLESTTARGGLSYTFFDELDGVSEAISLTAATDTIEAIQIASFFREAGDSRIDPFLLAFGSTSGSRSVSLQGIEASNLIGTNAHDDVMIYDGGATYLMGERDGDADLFIADFSGDDTTPLTIVIDDDPQAGDEGGRLANGVFVSGADRLIVLLGDDADTVRGGQLDDLILGGGGDDALTGDGGVDFVDGGGGNDILYWEGDDGLDQMIGGTDLDPDTDLQIDKDRLIVSNTREDGRAFGQAGLTQTLDLTVASDGTVLSSGEITITADSSLADLLLARDNLIMGDRSVIAFGADDAVTFEEFEAVDISGSNQFDDVVLYQDGLLYAGGERVGDADVFLADLSDEANDLTMTTLDATGGTARVGALQDIGNGVEIGEFERLIVETGSGDDRVEGGAFDDFIVTGAGEDLVVGSLGSDTVDLGSGNDNASYLGGDLLITGGEGIADMLEIGASQTGYSRLNLSTLPGLFFDVDDSLTAKREIIDGLVNPADGAAEAVITLTHELGELSFSQFDFVNASGDQSRDIFVSGTSGGVLSSDGGDDVLISRGGNDFLLGGNGVDRYVFGRDSGIDIIANETEGVNELHFVGRTFDEVSQAAFVLSSTVGEIIFEFDDGSRLVIRDYFAISANPQNYLYFTDDSPLDAQGNAIGRSLNIPVDTIIRDVTPSGAALRGNQQLGTEADDVLRFTTEGNDFFFGFGGDDLFVSSDGADVFDGSLGVDVVTYENAPSRVFATLSNGVGFQSGGSGVSAVSETDIFVSIESLIGSQFGDQLFGSVANDSLAGGGGSDTLNGFGGDDLLLGGDDIDQLIGGTGDDVIFGGAGDDFFLGGPLNLRDTVAPGESEIFGSGNDTLIGGEGNDRFDDRFGNNLVNGGAGDDTARGGEGADTYLYTDGSSIDGVDVQASGGLDLFEAHDLGFGGDGTDATDTGGDSVDFSEFGAAVAILLDDVAGASVAAADPGTIVGYAEKSGGPDDPYLTTVTVGDADNRRLLDFAGVENAVGSAFDDVIVGSARDNVLTGGFGDDVFIGGAGDDTLIGGQGADLIDYSGSTPGGLVVLLGDLPGIDESSALVSGSAIHSQDGVDQLFQIERVIGTAGDDAITGGDGEETITGFGGNDTLDGGEGRDVLDLSRHSETILTFIGSVGRSTSPFETLTGGLVGGSTFDVQHSGFEEIIFGASSDSIIGTDLDMVLDLGDGNNEFIGGTGDEDVTGGSGADRVLTGGGDDVYRFISGTDTVNPAAGRDTVGLGQGHDTLDLTQSDIGVTVEGSTSVTNRSGDIVFLETSGIDEVLGSAFDDFISTENALIFADGHLGNDFLLGDAETDALFGGEGDDTVTGLGGDDTLAGGLGADELNGGADNDLFFIEEADLGAGADVINGGTGDDVLDLGTLRDGISVVGDTIRNATGLIATISAVETVIGGAGDDTLGAAGLSSSLPEITVFEGGAGDDTAFLSLQGPSGEVVTGKTFDGGGGFDTADFSATPTVEFTLFAVRQGGVRVDFGTGAVTYGINVNTAGQIDIASVERVIGTSGEDLFLGDDFANVFVGGQGSDVFVGGGGNDTIDFGLDEGITSGVRVDLTSEIINISDGYSNRETSREVESIFGTARGDGLLGNDLANELRGGAGDDTIEGGGGADLLIDGIGTDSIDAGLGDDTVVHIGVDLPSGFDPVAGGILIGEETLRGGGGVDLLDLSQASGGLAFQMRTDAETQGLVFVGEDAAFSGDVVDRFQILATFDGFENLIGSAFSDVLDGDDKDNVIAGGGGNDTISGGNGADTLDGGAGIDVISYGSRTSGGPGVEVRLAQNLARDLDGSTDQIINFEGALGSAGDDTLAGDEGDNLFHGAKGDDLILGGDGVDTLDLSQGDATSGQIGFVNATRNEGAIVFLDARDPDIDFPLDTAPIASGGLVRDQFGGVDRVFEIETVIGTRFFDRITGDAGNNLISGRDGDDTLQGGGGRDTLEGGDGRDTFVIDEAGGIVIISDFVVGTDVLDLRAFSFEELTLALDLRPRDPGVLQAGAILSFRDGTTILLSGVSPDDFGDVDLLLPEADLPELRALAGGGTLGGTARAESLFGLGAPDLILGGDGDDFIDGGAGDDTIDGGAGRDIASFSSATVAGVSVNLKTGLVSGGAGNDVLRSIEGVIGSALADSITGSDNPDFLDSGSGADVLRPGGGADSISTGRGADIVAGSVSDLDGDVVTDFAPGDGVVLEGAGLASENVRLAKGSAIFEIDVDGDSVIDARFRLEGDFDEATFLLSRGPSGATTITNAGDVTSNVRLTDTGEEFATATTGALIDASSGNDTVTATGNGAVLVGGSGDDVLIGGAGSQAFYGGSGSDTMTGGGSRDRFVISAIEGRLGEPTEDVITDFQLGSDILQIAGFGLTQSSDLSIAGVVGGLRLSLSADQTVLLEGLSTGDVSDIEFAFDATTARSLASLAQQVRLSDGGDRYITVSEDDDLIIGGDGDDTLGGGAGADELIGGARSDTATYVTAASGVIVSLVTGLGTTGEAAGDILRSIESLAGSRFDDVLLGNAGANTLSGNGGDDSLSGDDGRDMLIGGLGEDTLEGGAGGDTLDGGQNGDLYFLRDADDVVIEAAGNAGIDRLVATIDVTLGDADIETVILAGDLEIDATANDARNFVLGSRGANEIFGLGGDDRIDGAGGDDTLHGGAGNDTLNGGPGSDVFFVDDLGDRVAESRRFEGTDTVISTVDFRMGTAHIENLELQQTARLGAGNGLQNIITGNDAANTLDGGKNVDTLIGGLGDDTYLIRAPGDNAVEAAGEGIDTVRAFRAHELDANIENLFLQTLRNAAGEGIAGVNGTGNELDNRIVGNPFDNVINGREGNDTLQGQAGADTFVFDSALGAGNVDTVVDFNTNAADEGDRLLVRQTVAPGVVKGVLAEGAFHAGLAATDATDRFVFDQASGQLFFDADGTGSISQQLIAVFQRSAVVEASDIVLF